jgi:glutamate 5-kinase
MTLLSFVTESDANAARERLGRARSVVVKVGSNVLVGGGVGAINRRVFTSLVESISNLMQMPDRRVVLVTSGAVALGRRRTGRSQMAGVEETLSVKQALAAVGQPSLMHLYSEEFAFYGLTVAQLLLTREDVDDRERFLSARSTLRELASMPGVLPIINENDTVANAEIRFGDNDQLAALVAGLVEADLLIILSDVAAIYDRNPSKHADARAIGTVYADDPALLEIAEPPAAGAVSEWLRLAARHAQVPARADGDRLPARHDARHHRAAPHCRSACDRPSRDLAAKWHPMPVRAGAFPRRGADPARRHPAGRPRDPPGPALLRN